MGEGVDDSDIGARPQRQMEIGLDMRHLDEIDTARIDDDQPRAGAQPPFHARGENWMGVGRIGADDHDDVGFIDRIEILRAGGCSERRLEAVTGRRMADTRAGVDIAVAEARAHELLDEKHLFVGAARRGDGADGIAPVTAAAGA